MSQYININSQLDALKLKEIETSFYNSIKEDNNIVPKITPFKGINRDLLYIKDNQILFIKFMDTTEDLFFILEEELLEEIERVKRQMENAHYNFQNAMDPDLIDCYIFESNAAWKKYRFLLKQAKML